MASREVKDVVSGGSLPSLDEIGLKYCQFDFGKGKLYTGGDKTSLGQGFTADYETLFAPWRARSLQLLELGVFFGKSLAMWSEYFPNGSIHGVDCSLTRYREHERTLKRLGMDTERVTVHQVDLTNEADVKSLVEKLPKFDIVIDDANHTAAAQLANFVALFKHVAPGGYYVVEDIVEPLAFFQHFSPLLVVVANANAGAAESTRKKEGRLYSLGMQIESMQIKKNLVVFKRKT